jgi:hypothetical protein
MSDLKDMKYLRANLAFVYRLILASENLLRVGIQFASGELKEYFEKHLVEEAGHDKVLLEDLQGLGMDTVPHSHLAAELAGSQYYLIIHEHPSLLLGYMQALEESSLGVPVVEELQQHHGKPLKALMHHAKHDPQHTKDITAQIGALPFVLQSAVYWNKSFSYALLATAKRQLQERGWIS